MTTLSKPTHPHAKPVPPLQNGDRLTRDEFERRYELMPPGVKAELIEGIVYMPPPVSEEFHGRPHLDMSGWLTNYLGATPGVTGGDNSTLRLDLDNMPQPDCYLRILPEHGGQSRSLAGGFVEGAPELVVEVAASSAGYDLGAKLNAYRRNGVREYVVRRTYDNAIDWFVLRHGLFEPLPPGPDGIHRSEVFPGLWLDAAAMIRGDIMAWLRGLQQGTASPEHAAFVNRLRAARQP